MKIARLIPLIVCLLLIVFVGVDTVTQAGATTTGVAPSSELASVAAKVSTAPVAAPLAQFDSGSDGSNGAFPPVALPGGTTDMVLDLRDGTLTFQPGGTTTVIPDTPSGGFADGVLRFTTMEVPAGVTLSFIENAGNTPVSILAQGDVDVLGTIDVRGEAGGSSATGRGGFAAPGGFKGGNGQILNSSPEGGHGLGPGGGKGGGFGGDADGLGGGGGGGFGSVGAAGQAANPNNGGGTYGTLALLPLVGGSGGGGGSGDVSGAGSGGGGGGGGGAILIASSTKINIAGGSILANGGAGGAGVQNQPSSGGGGGSGGGIRLMAETLEGSGPISAAGGIKGGAGSNRKGGEGGRGRIRLEAVFFNYTGTATGIVSNGGLGVVFIPNLPTVNIVSVGGDAVPPDPTGYRGGTDVIIAGPGIATVALAATQVPVGTTISVTAKPETDALVIGPVVSPGLAGTLENSTTSVDLDFPAGGIYFLEARATFAVP